MKINRLGIFMFVMSIFFGATHRVHADVVINEIAWMGTATSVNDEWIELFNNGTTPVFLDGWTLRASDASPTITLQGTLSAGGYMLLERTDDNSVPGITAGVIYAGALGNEGETLVIKNNTEQVMDTVAMIGGWTAGNASTKETMQRNGSNWITGIATPAAQNPTSGANSGQGNTDPDDGNDDSGPTTNPETATEEKEIIIHVEPDPVYSSRMITPDIFIQQVPLDFNSEVKKDGIAGSLRGRFEWSMGDGGSFIFKKSTPFTYIYQEPGQYVIMLRYYSNIFKTEPDTIHKKTITVIPATVSITTNSSGTIALTNNSNDDIDLGKWKLRSESGEFTFPSFTILQKGSKINIPQSIQKLNSVNLSLITPNGYVASRKSNTIGHKTSSTSNYQMSPVDNPDSEILFQETNHENKSFFITPKALNYHAIIWIILFIILLTIATIGLHIFMKKVEATDEVVPVREK